MGAERRVRLHRIRLELPRRGHVRADRSRSGGPAEDQMGARDPGAELQHGPLALTRARIRPHHDDGIQPQSHRAKTLERRNA